MPTFSSRLQHAWNAFVGRDPTRFDSRNLVVNGSSFRPDRMRLGIGNERTIVNAIYNRISMDIAAINIKHVEIDQNGRYKKDVDSGLNNVLSLDANTDQTGRAFIQDIVMSLFDEGCIAVLPIDTDKNPDDSSYEIESMRTAKIIEWYPKAIKVKAYNDNTGKKEEIIVPKSSVAIIENPLYSIMNEPNSILKRLIRKLALLDYIDEESSSKKLDLIVQLPYVIKSQSRREQAEARRKDIEMQLSGSKYGIAYTDGTEKITQLNRPVENNLMSQIEYLTTMLYSQLGITSEILNGTANEQAMQNYYSRTIEPIISAITDEFQRKFLTKNARTRGQRIMFFRDPFKLVPVNNLADIADKFTRNEIMSSNEVRAVIGLKPSEDPKADELRNKNLNDPMAAMGNPEDSGMGDMSDEPTTEDPMSMSDLLDSIS